MRELVLGEIELAQRWHPRHHRREHGELVRVQNQVRKLNQLAQLCVRGERMSDNGGGEGEGQMKDVCVCVCAWEGHKRREMGK